MRNLIIIISILSISISVFGQSSGITRVDLKEDFLITFIEDYIQESSKDSLFKSGLGYLSLSIKLYSNRDTIRSYDINIYYYDQKKNNTYPQYYTIIKDRLVCIYFKPLSQVLNFVESNSKNEKRFIRILEKYLPKKQKIEFTTQNGERVVDKSFRDEIVTIDGGKELILLKDGFIVKSSKTYK